MTPFVRLEVLQIVVVLFLLSRSMADHISLEIAEGGRHWRSSSITSVPLQFWYEGPAPRDFALNWRTLASGAPLQSEGLSFALSPGVQTIYPVNVTAPDARRRVTVHFLAEALVEESQDLRAAVEANFRVYPRETVSWSFLRNKRVAVFNAPEGVLEDIREAAADVVVFDTWYDVFGFQGDVVLLGPGRFENLEEFHRFISSLSNGSVSCPLVVLNQVWGGSPPVWHDSAITVHAPEHALLRDLTVDDFRGWDWDDRSLSACPAIPPPPGNFRRLVGAGPPGILLLHIPLPNGRSAFLAQYALWNRLEIEPAAPVLLNRLLSVALGSSGTPLQGSVSLIGDPESPFVLRLQLALVGEEAKLSVLPGDREDLQLPVPPAAVLLDASGEGADHLYSRDPEFAEKTRRFAESGGVACLFAVEPDTRDLFDWALPDSVDLETSNDSSGELALTDEEALARTGADAWIRALAKSGEMYRFADENRGGPASVSDFFRLESVGRGKVCFFQFRPGSAPTEALRLIVNQTLTNLGVRIFPENGIMSSN